MTRQDDQTPPANDNAWTIADVRRALKAVRSGGETIAAVDFPKSGGFRILIGDPIETDLPPRSGANDWDEVLAG